MARRQPFHAISVCQHTLVVLFFCSYLRTYAPRPAHSEFDKTHIIRERNGILNHYKFNNSEPCGTRNPKSTVGIGRILSCLLKRNLLQSLSTIHSYGSHKHKHTLCRAASYRLSWPVEVPRIDDTPHSPNRYTTICWKQGRITAIGGPQGTQYFAGPLWGAYVDVATKLFLES